MDANDTRHIWLRQTVTYTVDGQTRTLEVGIPVPNDATAQDVEDLLGVAEIGMSALSRRLDARIAEALGGGVSNNIPALPPSTPETPSANGYAPTDTVSEHLSSVAEPPIPHTREAKAESVPEVAKAPTPAATGPARPINAPERPAPQQRPAEPPRSQPLAAAPAGGGEMTRQQFLAAVAALGLNPRQAMDQLGVRSLEGLNLREALESLRRQLLGITPNTETGIEEESEPDDVSTIEARTTLPRQFEEEDDETILFTMDDDDELEVDDITGSSGDRAFARVSEESVDELDLDDEDDEDDEDNVPDLTPPAPARQRTSTTARKPRSVVRETPIAATDDAPTSSGSLRTQAMRQIGKLRSTTGGGTASDYQRNAYRNIVEHQLGKSKAATLVRGLWRTTVDHLTAGQLDALIRWGKEDEFAVEAVQVLSALQAEQRRAAQDEASAASSDAPAQQTRATSRGRPAGGAR
jgi:hypothetical protein